MSVPLFKKVEGKKYMWDGATYADREEAQKMLADYEANGFEAKVFEEGDQFLVYSRRVAEAQSAG